ncbi:PKD domain-containing protein [Prolixibacter denitrificans]|uniref:PKD domain-containing protein n=1 Tax=Prolixibacter denitrificans TaxID=1541063 RepID=UPI0014792D89|nr:PKD domain-containing protein [Prolixibacter denitrificans]
MVSGKFAGIQVDGFCAPVNAYEAKAVYNVLKPASQISNTLTVKFDYGDGTVNTVAATINSDPSNPKKSIITAVDSHVYPSTPNGSCVYTTTTVLLVDGVECNNTSATQQVTVWDKDDSNGGSINIYPYEVQVCVGQDTTITFQDQSIWNCTKPPVDKPNYQDRITKFTYGTDNNPSNRIPGIELIRPDGVIKHPGNYSVEGDTTHYGYIADGPYAPKNQSWQVHVPVTDSTDVGKVFEIRLDNWNFCNPYPDNDPVSGFARIVIIDKPWPKITPVSPVCSADAPFNLVVTGRNVTGAGTWSGPGVSSTGLFDPSKANIGTNQIIYTEVNNGGCEGVDTTYITVKQSPNLNFSLSDTEGCEPLVVYMTNNSTNTDNYEWDFGDGTTYNTTTNETVSNIYTVGNGDETFTITLNGVNNNGCISTQSKQVLVHDTQKIGIAASDSAICAPQKIKFWAVGGGSGSVNTHDRYWDFEEDGTYIKKTNPIVEFDNQTGENDTVTVSLITVSQYGCRDTAYLDIIVYPNLGAHSTLGDPIDLCLGSTIELNGHPNSKIKNLSSSWTSTNNGLDYLTDKKPYKDSIVHFLGSDPSGSVPFNVRYIVSTKVCADTVDFNLNVADLNVTLPDTVVGCTGEPLEMVPTITGGSGNYVSHSWTGTDASYLDNPNVQNPNFVAGTPGIYHLDYSVSDDAGCSDNASTVVKILEMPTSNAGADQDTCGLVADLHANQSPIYPAHWVQLSGPGTSTFSNTSAPASGVTVSSYGTYEFGWTVVNQTCEAVDTVVVNFIQIPTPNAGPDDSVCGLQYNLSGSAALGNGFWTQVSGPGTATFEFSDRNNTLVDVDQQGSYVFRWTDDNGNGCSSSDDVTIDFVAYPDPFISVPDTSGCSPYTLQMSDGGTVGGSTYIWDYGDGKRDTVYTADPVSHTYHNTSSGLMNFVITLTIQNGTCETSTQQEITVKPDFLVGSPVHFEGCNPSTFGFVNANPGATWWNWDFGDGSANSSQQSPSHTFTSPTGNDTTFVVRLTGESSFGCIDTVDNTVTVYQRAVAAFSASDTVGCNPLAVDFTNQSQHADQYLWTFDDGMSSLDTDPPHTFSNGTDTNASFRVRLIATNSSSCSDTAFQNILVHPIPVTSFDMDYLPGCSPVPATFTNKTTGAIKYLWDFDDGQSSSDFNTTHDFINDSTYIRYFRVRLTATNTYGCINSLMREVTVYPTQHFDFSIMPDTACSPANVIMVADPGAYTYTWDFGDGRVNPSNKYLASHTYTNSTGTDAVYTVKLNSSSFYGCKDSTTHQMLVKPEVKADITLSDNYGCDPLVVNIQNNSLNGDYFYWDYGDGRKDTTGYAANYSVTYTNPNLTPVVYNLKLVVESAEGCRDSVSYPIQVLPGVTAGFSVDTVGCSPLVADFVNTATGAYTMHWDFGDGTVDDTNFNPQHIYNATGNAESQFTVMQVARSSGGCLDTAYATMHVYPVDKVYFNISDTTGCTPLNTTLHNTSPDGVSYEVDYGDGTTETLTTATDLTHQYLNTGTSPQTYNLVVKSTNSFGCQDSVVKSIVVYPNVTASFTADTAGCAPFVVDFTNTSTGAFSYEWDFGDGGSKEYVKDPVRIFNNYGLSDTIYNVSLAATSLYGCSDTAHQAFLVAPAPVADLNAPNYTGCSPFTFEGTNVSTGATTYYWDFGDGATQTTNSLGNITHLYTNNTTTPVTYNLKLKAVNSLGCSDSLTVSIRVLPKVTADFAPDTTGCSILDVQFRNLSTNAQQFEWDFGDGSGINYTADPSHRYETAPGVDADNTVKLISKSYYGCVDSITRNVHVWGSPQANFSMWVTNVTADTTTVEFTNLSNGAVSYVLDYGDGNTVSLGSWGTETHKFVSPTATTSYSITLTATSASGCTDAVTQVLATDNLPQIVFDPDTVGCSPVVVQFRNSSTFATSYTWKFGDGTPDVHLTNPKHTFENNGTTDQTYTVWLIGTTPYGKTDSVSHTVTVYANPQASFNIPIVSGCSPFDAIFENNSTGATTYTWDFGDSAKDTTYVSPATLSHTYVNATPYPQSYQVTLTATSANGCTSTANDNVLATPGVQAAFTSATDGCAPLNVQFENNSVGAYYYLWDFGDGSSPSSQMDPSHTFYNLTDRDTVYTVKMVAYTSDGCKDSLTENITVYGTPNIDLTYSATNGCAPFNVEITDNSTPGTTMTYDWGDGTPKQVTTAPKNITHEYKNTSLQTISRRMKVTATSPYGCESTSEHVFVVYPQVTAGFNMNPTAGCSPLRVQFTNTALAESYLDWDFGDGSNATSANPQHVFVNTSNLIDQVFNVRQIATSVNGCADTLQQAVTVHPAPEIKVSVSDTVGCAPLTVRVDNLSLSGQAYTVKYGDGVTETINSGGYATHTYTASHSAEQFYKMVIQGDNPFGCTDSIVKNIHLYPTVTADFVSDTQGCSPLPVRFQNTSQGAFSYEWKFDDGTTDFTENPVRVFENNTPNDSINTVQLVAYNNYGCSDTTSQTITVSPAPIADIAVSSAEGCAPFTVNVTNNSYLGYTFHWVYGDGTDEYTAAGQSVSHTYENTGVTPVYYDLKLVVETLNGCRDSVIRKITVLPEVKTAMVLDTIGCSPLFTTLQNLTTGAQQFVWDYGDGTPTSTAYNPSHTFVNMSTTNDTIYTVKLVAKSFYGCEDSTYQDVTVLASPHADFTVDKTTGCGPLDIQLENQSVGGVTYTVKYGDGTEENIAEGAIVNHTYHNTTSQAVSYSLRVLVESATGCVDSMTTRIEVLPELNAAFSSDSIGCAPLGIRFNNESSGATAYQWDFDDGSAVENFTSPYHLFDNSSFADTIYNVKLLAYSPYGCVDSTMKDITVHPTPNADISAIDVEGCTPFDAMFSNHTTGADSYAWDFGDGTTSTTSDTLVNHTYVNANPMVQSYHIWVKASNNFGCSDDAYESVQVNPFVKAAFSADTVGCSPLTLDFKNLSEGAYSYEWYFGDGSGVYRSTNPSHTFVNSSQKDTIFHVMLISMSRYGCSDTARMDIRVYPTPVASFSVNSLGGCAPYTLEITDQSVGAENYLWKFGDGTTSTDDEENFTHDYLNSGQTTVSYPLTLQVENEIGCKSSYTADIEVHPMVAADFQPDKNEGCSPLTVSFSNLSTGGATYYWDFADASFSSEFQPRHTFVNTTSKDSVFMVQLVATSVNGCTDTISKSILVHPTPQTAFSVDPQVQTFPDKTVQITNETPGGPWDYVWNFGDMTEEVEGDVTSHDFEEPGNYDITLTASSDFCSQKVVQRVTVLAGPPSAVFEPDTAGCPPLRVQFRNQSENGFRYVWDFGDGNYSTQKTPDHTFFAEGTYNVHLQVFNQVGDVAESEKQIVVYPAVRAYFNLYPSRVKIPGEKVSFSNFSENADNYLWDFGDGDTSTVYEPEHEYQKEGVFPVTLIATSKFGCVDTFTVSQGVETYSDAKVSVPNAFMPSKDGPNGGKYTPGDRYNHVFYPVVAKGDIEQYQMQIFNRWGNLMFLSNDIDIGWDGYYNGELASPGVYIWRIKCTFKDGSQIIKAGDVTLLQ